jgi:hypothetical protein
LKGFIEANGHVSIEAENYTRAVETDEVTWTRIPDIGRTGSGMTPFPVTSPSVEPDGESPRLEYEMTLTTDGPVEVWVYLSPRNNVLPTDGPRYGISFNDDTPQIVNIRAAHDADPVDMNAGWSRNTADNVNRTVTSHVIDEPGVHTLNFWMVDPTVIVQKIVVDTGDKRFSYLGPPESLRAESFETAMETATVLADEALTP